MDRAGNIRSKTYIPCYPITLDANGDAVSLPGGHNVYGAYKTLRDYAKSYAEGAVSDYAIIEPTDVDHYEWLLETIEFATQNIQTVMQGASTLPYSDNHKIVAAPAANQIVLAKEHGQSFVVGQTFQVCESPWSTPGAPSAYNQVTALDPCDAAGTLRPTVSMCELLTTVRIAVVMWSSVLHWRLPDRGALAPVWALLMALVPSVVIPAPRSVIQAVSIP